MKRGFILLRTLNELDFVLLLVLLILPYHGICSKTKKPLPYAKRLSIGSQSRLSQIWSRGTKVNNFM